MIIKMIHGHASEMEGREKFMDPVQPGMAVEASREKGTKRARIFQTDVQNYIDTLFNKKIFNQFKGEALSLAQKSKDY